MVEKQMVIDLTSKMGPLKFGASGFLYGLGNKGIPNVNMLTPIKPQVAAQKPEGGLQHPNGDALNVSDTYIAAGGKEIEIYMQDIYPNWPYDNLGIDDYLNKVDSIVRQVMTSPNRSLFSYVPFNEPDQIWYNKSDKKQSFFCDWKLVFQKIKTLDPGARIVGPNLYIYDSTFYRDFLAFAKNNTCLPDVISWHELNDDFFTDWYVRYHDYRSNENSLGIPTREICINEYGRKSGDLGIPGKLVQWIARFENCKVDACLAYWATAGCLDDLVSRDTYNQATGSWWLYKWYGSMTGDTVTVTSSDENGEGLQGLASLDPEKKQVRFLFGGSNGSIGVVVKGFDSTPDFGNEVHVIVWEVTSTGQNPSAGPALVMQGNYPINNGQITVTNNNLMDTTAYQMIITPGRGLSSVNHANCYEAEYAEISGASRIIYNDRSGCSGSGFVKIFGGNIDASMKFIVTASTNGFYCVKLRYSAGPMGGNPYNRAIRIMLNGFQLMDMSIPTTLDWNIWVDFNLNIFLMAGINQIVFNTLSEGDSAEVAIDYIEVTPGSGSVDTYEAEAEGNTLGGTSAVIEDPAASGGKCVAEIGNGGSNILQFNNIEVSRNGIYQMVITYANAEFRGSHEYNGQVVDRYADICVNGRTVSQVYFRNTFAWNVYRTVVIGVELKAGKNTIRFSNNTSFAPNIDKIEIAQPFQPFSVFNLTI